ncbi:MAG TPA: hypothetical protein VFS24_02935, partial [Steroidobacteraceae bacterium]|nr:hypothetical protein [Steroidobacteraceae bacterium]
MLNRVCNDVLLGPIRGSFVHLLALAAALALGYACKVHAETAPAAAKAESPAQKGSECLPKQQGFL